MIKLKLAAALCILLTLVMGNDTAVSRAQSDTAVSQAQYVTFLPIINVSPTYVLDCMRSGDGFVECP